MKHKFSSMGRVAIALVLALSLSLVTAVPVSAEPDVTNVTVALSTNLAEVEDVEYTISFDLGKSLLAGETITLTFDDAYTLPDAVANDTVTVDEEGLLGTEVDITVEGDTIVITLPSGITTGDYPVVVVLTSGAKIVNPVADTGYTLSVATQKEPTPAASVPYDILALPTVTGVFPNAGNMGETMWVEVEGSNFIKDDTELDFGSGVDVVPDSYQFVTAGEIDCQITITGSGDARDVVVTTPAGDSVANSLDEDNFTPNPVKTPQVDVWTKYTPTALPFTSETLVFNADEDNPFDTIQEAIDAATGSGTEVIRVHEAEYNPTGRYPIVVNKANVNLVAFGSPKIVPGRPGSAMSDGVISIAADSVTIDGFNIVNEAFISGDWGISAKGSKGGTNFTIQNNTVSGFGDDSATWSNCVAIRAMTASGKILNNTVDGNRTGIELSGSNNTTIQGNLIQNNRIGIALYASTDAKVTQNKVYTSSDSGIFVTTSSTFATFELNDIMGNVIGLNNDTATGIAAEYNYWGEIGGPSAGTARTEYNGTAGFIANTTALGNGDAISDGVLYNPWLSVSYERVVDEGIRFYGSDTLKLQPGWNTLSVPLELYDLANTLTEIDGLGDFLDDIAIAYAYDAVKGTWVVPPDMYELELVPCRGYYIKMDADMAADTSFPVIYSNELGLPALELAAGWNLIGSAFGIDKLTNETWAVGDPDSWPTEATKSLSLALDSIGAQASVVVSPSAPGQLGDPWSEIWSEDTENCMYTGEGYWVFMTDTDTLCGFEITPFYFDPAD